MAESIYSFLKNFENSSMNLFPNLKFVTPSYKEHNNLNSLNVPDFFYFNRTILPKDDLSSFRNNYCLDLDFTSQSIIK